MSDDKKPVTTEMMKAYITILERQVSQMTLVVNTLEELNDKLEKVEGHFHNGFKSEITDHITDQVDSVMEKMEKTLTTLYIIKEHVQAGVDSDKELASKAYILTNEIKDKIGSVKADITELKSALKVERSISIIGWSSFVITMITIVLKLFGKI